MQVIADNLAMPTQKMKADARLQTPPRSRRSSGRPAADASVGRDIILMTTVQLLKTRTPEQLSILEIASAAGVTRALVRYYFTNLKELLREVTEFLMSELQDRMEAAIKTEGSVADRVHQRLLLRLNFMHEHPQFERLALSEIYHFESRADAPIPAETPLKRITQRGLELTTALMTDATHTSTLDPRFLHLAILSISAFLPSAQPLLVELFGKGPEADRQVEKYLRFMSSLLADKIQQDAAPQVGAQRSAGMLVNSPVSPVP